LAGCIFSVAVVASFFSIMFRPDGEKDLLAGIIWNAVLTGPMWAAVVFLMCRRTPTDTKSRNRGAIIAAIVVYAVVVSSLHGCNMLKMEARMSAARHAEQMMQQTAAEEAPK
jgi:hypothetical protein